MRTALLFVLFLGACAADETAGGEFIEWAYRPDSPEDIGLVSTQLQREGDTIRLHVQTHGPVATVQWLADKDGMNEPHYLIADAWAADEQLGTWVIDLLIGLPEDTVSTFATQVDWRPGLVHGFTIQSQEGDTVDCAVVSPEPWSGEGEPCIPDGPAWHRLVYDD